jgi:hypothetical protein
LREFGDAPGGHDKSRLEEYMEEVDLKAVDQKRGVMAADTRFVGYLIVRGM